MGRMKMVILMVLIGLGILVAVLGFFGGFSKVNLQNINVGGETLVYQKVSGSYSQSSKVSHTVYCALLHDYKIETTKGFGIYYDNPKHVEQNKLRSEIGCIVESVDDATIKKLQEKFLVKILPNETYLVSELPFRGALSVILGMIKVYPAIAKYIRENNYADAPIMEIYDVPNRKIIYRKFLCRQ
jgi:hypothetical protein